MNYFTAISKRAEELNQLGQEYLDTLPFMSNQDVGQRLWEIAQDIDSSNQENPEWVDFTLDGAMPYYGVPRNGSLYFSLGYAQTAQDACLRNLLELAEERTQDELELATIAEKEIVNSYVTK